MRRINVRSKPKWLRWGVLLVAAVVLSCFYISRMQSMGQAVISSRGGGRKSPPTAVPPPTNAPAVRRPSPDVDVGDVGTARPPAAHAEVDVHLLVLWHGAIAKRGAILDHITGHFAVLDIKAFDWSSADGALPDDTHLRASTRSERTKLLHDLTHYDDKDTTAMLNDYFLMNLWRLYSGKGGGKRVGMPLKVRQCGRGPFIGIVVVDEHPQYRSESTAHGTDYVNHNMNEAKRLYRKWSGGGFRVHGTFNPAEAAHDVTLLFHKHPDAYAQMYRQLQASGGDENSRSAASRGKALVAQFREAIAWPFELASTTADKNKASFVGPEGTLGVDRHTFHYDAHTVPPTSPVWASCRALLDVLLAPWPADEQTRLRTEGFYAWDTTANFPSLPLAVEDCETWPNEWAVVVHEPVWWATAALLNGRLPVAGAGVDQSITEGKPERIAIAVKRAATQYVHIQSLLSEDHLPN